MNITPVTVFAASTTWAQNNWVGGAGQNIWSDASSYGTGTGINTTVANQITLSTNTNWFDVAWKYRNSITISNSSGTTLINYQVPLYINTAALISSSKMKGGCEDLRIVDANKTNVPYWIATSPSSHTCNQTTTKVWIKIDSISPSGVTLYLYYGNSGASSQSNGGNVFPVFADFTLGSSLPTGWIKTDVGTSGTATVGSGKLSLANTNGSDVWVTSYGGTHAYNNATINGSFIAETLLTSQTNSDPWAKTGISVQNSVSAVGENGQAFIIATPGNGYDLQYQDQTGQGCSLGSCTEVVAANANSNSGAASLPVFLKLTKNGSNQIAGYYSSNGSAWTQQGGVVTPWGVASNQYVTLMVTPHNISGTSTATYTFFYIRAFSATEPTSGSWGSEQKTYTASGVLTSSIFDTQGSTNYGVATFSATIPTNTSVALKVRTASSADMAGTTDFASCNSISSGADISTTDCVTNGQRYVQYQVTLSSSDPVSTPTFQGVSFLYTMTPIYSLAYVAGSHGSLTGTLLQSVVSGGSGSAVMAVANEHYHFVNWSDSITSNPRTDTTVAGNISVTANFAIDTYTISYSAGSHGSITGNGNQTVNYGGDSSQVTATADALYHFTNWSDGSTANPRIDYNTTQNISVTANFAANDPNAPVLSDINATSASTSAMINWKTDESASSQVQYGVNDTYGFSTGEMDTVSRVTNHAIELENLASCARYYYRVLSKDATNNQSASAQKTFNTSGCVTSSITSGSEELLPISGGTVELVNNLSTAHLIAPQNYSTEQATFQLNKLDTEAAPTGPDGKTIAANNFYDLVAVTTSNVELTRFSQPVTFTINYGADTETNFHEQTLDVYKYDGNGWIKKNCTLDTAANTITCELSGFSIYAVLGDPVISNSSNSSSSSPQTNSSSSQSSTSCSASKPATIPDLFQIDTTTTTAKLFFTPIDTNDFYISFSEAPDAEMHGAAATLAREGVQNYSVYLLKPHTTYYFKVRGQNGCMPGDWSNIMKINTNSSIYYKDGNISASVTQNTVKSREVLGESISITPTKIQNPYPPQEVKKIIPTPTLPQGIWQKIKNFLFACKGLCT